MGRAGQGRPSRPTALKVIRGERASRINTAEPIPADGEVLRPTWLSASAAEVWGTYAPDLIARKILTPWDVEHFAVWCDAAATARAASAALDAQGMVIETDAFDRNGRNTGKRLTRNPWVLVLKDSTSTMQRFGARFGMTPSDRAQLNVAPPTARSRVEDLLS